MAEELTIGSLMAKLPAAFQADKATGVNAVIQFDLGGDRGGEWYITLADGACTVDEGTAENPKLTINADGQDMLDIFKGDMNAMAAFSSGKLKVSGDLGLSMKLLNFFKF
ncbi:MAG: SCP2 sterol-binding domain-containing protein [Chloroflexi bacterium]|nr:SCP2 sterol-binding domain-containing protein [Chloroflexota bacterium]